MGSEIFVETGRKPILIEVTVYSPQEVKGHMLVIDPYKKNTVYCDRDMYVSGYQTFYIRMPFSPETVRISSNIQITNIARKHLPRKFSKYDIQNLPIREFLDFAEEFSVKAGYLQDNLGQASDNGNYKILYLPVLRNEDGSISKTPCRINSQNGVMEVSSQYFREFTVFMRFALLLHEFCHFFVNKTPENEFEADKNSLFIYLGLGAPRFEAFQAWATTFDGSSNNVLNGHKRRLAQIESIINNYDEKFKSISFIK